MQSATLVHDTATYTTTGMRFLNVNSGREERAGSGGDAYDPLLHVTFNTTSHVLHTGVGEAFPPATVAVHPAQTRLAVVGWKSPITGVVAVSGNSGVKDLNASCGNGINWDIQLKTHSLAHGAFPNGGAQLFSAGVGGSALAHIAVHRGDVLYFVVDPNVDYSCDLTELDVTIQRDLRHGWRHADHRGRGLAPS